MRASGESGLRVDDCHHSPRGPGTIPAPFAQTKPSSIASQPTDMARTPRRRRGGSPQEDMVFTGRPEEESLVAPPKALPNYRLITGMDDATFCQRVSEALQ
jgi:Domain of unknown function (DUF1737)